MWKVFDNGNEDNIEICLYRDDTGNRDDGYYMDKIVLWTNTWGHRNDLNPCNWQQIAKARIYAKVMCDALNAAHKFTSANIESEC